MYTFKVETKIGERIPTTKTITSITELAQEFDDIHNSSHVTLKGRGRAK